MLYEVYTRSNLFTSCETLISSLYLVGLKFFLQTKICPWSEDQKHCCRRYKELRNCAYFNYYIHSLILEFLYAHRAGWHCQIGIVWLPWKIFVYAVLFWAKNRSEFTLCIAGFPLNSINTCFEMITVSQWNSLSSQNVTHETREISMKMLQLPLELLKLRKTWQKKKFWLIFHSIWLQK